MDELLRTQAQEHINTARTILSGFFSEDSLKKAIECLEKIQYKHITDYELLCKTYFKLATQYFNKADYHSAVEYYSKGINYLHQLPASDELYRTLMKEYINLSDCFIELKDHTASATAIEYAKRAFSLIQARNPSEIEIGDPNINFETFYSYIQRQVSDRSYRKSVGFKNNRNVHIAGQQEMSCLSGLAGLTFMGKIEQENRYPHGKNSFSSIASHSSTTEYRILLKQYWAMAQQHNSIQKIACVRETFEQIKDTLNKIDPAERTEQERYILGQIEDTRSIGWQSNLTKLLKQFSVDVFSAEVMEEDDDTYSMN